MQSEEWGGGDEGAANGVGFNGLMGPTPFPGAAPLDVPAGCILVPAPGPCFALPSAFNLAKVSFHAVNPRFHYVCL